MNKLCLVVVLSLAAFVAADNVYLTVTVDNILEELYIDGVRVPDAALPNRLDWPSVDVVSIPTATQVVAVYGSDYGVVAGILLSVAGDLLVTNGSWRCINKDTVTALDWSEPDFDDSQWPAASVILPNPNNIHGNVAAISSNAKWIWTAAGIENSRVLCRGRMNPKPAPPTEPPVPDVCAVKNREECGWPGISREACLARVGCCFDDSIPEVKWCYKSTTYSTAVCAVKPKDRVECGWPGIPREVCLSHPQCCFDDSIPEVKWCFRQHDYEYTVRSEVCAIKPKDRVECGWPGILISECLSRAGCCFDDSIPEVKWCFRQKQDDCNVWPADRTDCGWPGISPEDCQRRGCCFDDTWDNTKWCFYKNKVMLPECELYAPWNRTRCGSRRITVSQCQMNQDTCCYDNTYSYQNPPFCYQQSDICDVAPEDKVDCGWPGITADRCLARGCCFDDSQDGPWCFKKA